MSSALAQLTTLLSRSFAKSFLSCAVFCVIGVLTMSPLQAQTFQVIHNFTGPDGSNPNAGLTMDAAGHLYGTTQTGGYQGGQCGGFCGTAFKMSRQGSNWTLVPIYLFGASNNDGQSPQARLIIGSNGSLYSTTTSDFNQSSGTVFNLQPPAHFTPSVFAKWGENILYHFQGGLDGVNPGQGDLVFDAQGNIYGTTWAGGSSDKGTVYKLTPSNGGWIETILHSFTGGNDGGSPVSGVILDSAGNLYGTTLYGGAGNRGTVYRLSLSNGVWVEQVLYSFQGNSDGELPSGGLIFDSQGNLYGSTTQAGINFGGTAFMLSPSGGGWQLHVLYSFSFAGPSGSMTMDTDGNLYGTTGGGLYLAGNVFKLTRSGGGYTYTSLHDFSNGDDGGYPIGNVALDHDGNIYGTASSGGVPSDKCPGDTCGVVWEITP